MGKLKDFIVDFLLSQLGKFDDSINDAVVNLTLDIFDSGGGGSTLAAALYNIAHTLSEIVKPVAISILAVCLVIEILKVTLKMESFNLEMVVGVFCKSVIAVAAFEIAFQFLSMIYSIGSGIIVSMAGGGTAALVEIAYNMLIGALVLVIMIVKSGSIAKSWFNAH